MHEQLRVSDLKDTLEKERSERVEVGASLVERDREVHRLLAEIERRYSVRKCKELTFESAIFRKSFF